MPGFAFGNDQSTALSASTIVVDAAQITADQQKVELAKSGKVTATLSDNGDIIFVPGNGGAPAMEPRSEISNDAEPEAISASSLAELVRQQDVDDALNAEERCLAGAVYFESKGESLPGQLAVARVVMARAKSGRFAFDPMRCRLPEKPVFVRTRWRDAANRRPAVITGGTP